MADVPAWLSVWLRRKLLKSEPIWIRIHMDVWPSAKACRVQSEIFGILFRKVGVMVGAADSMLWVTRSRTSQTFRSDTHTDLFRGWRRLWCSVWKLRMRSRIVSFNNPTNQTRVDSGCPTSARSIVTDFAANEVHWFSDMCVWAWLICVFSYTQAWTTFLTQPTDTTLAFPHMGKLN